MSREETPNRREIEDTTAARLAEIVAGAERAARQVIDEAEAEARERLSGAEAEAERIVSARLAELAELAAKVEAQAVALKDGAESLRQALAEVRAQTGDGEAPGSPASVLDPGSSGNRASPREAEAPGGRRSSSPSLTVVGPAPVAPERPVIGEARSAEGAEAEVSADFAGDGASSSPDGETTPAGARLLATQMAVSGASRAEIDARLHNGFGIADTTAILDAILGPENQTD